MKSTLLFLCLMAMSNLNFGQSLDPCPNSPNCVSSQEARRSKRKAPYTYTTSTADAIAQLKSVIAERYPSAQLIQTTDNQLTYEFHTKVGKFIDDVVFVFDVEKSVIHFRSASREGYGDFGANKRRIRKIRKWLNEKG